MLFRKKSDYENMNNDIVQGDEEPHIDDDEGEIIKSQNVLSGFWNHF